MRKVAFHTLGCKLNFSETATLARQFEQRGYERVDWENTPDIFVINTCSVTDNADKKCRYFIRKAKEISPDAYVLIVGCYAQLKPKEIAEIPGVDAVLGAAEKFRMFELLDDFTKRDTAQVCASEIAQADTFHAAYSDPSDRTRAFLKVQDGCDYNCSFCTIPLARGRSRSDTPENVLQAARQIAQTSVQEVVLTGVNTGDYGIIEGKRQTDFFSLIQELDKVEGIERFRISSIEPNLLHDEIIDFVAQSRRFVPHFHIPLQSGSDRILRQMRRRYKSPLYADRVRRIRQQMPDACIGVDVIVGFPGEDEAAYQETFDFLHELDISYLHVFTYSERPNTRADTMTAVVPVSERNRRSKQLRNLSHKKRHQFYQSQLGTTGHVLWENDIKGGKVHGFTENYVRLETDYRPELPNTIQEVELVELTASGCVRSQEVAVNV